MQQIRFYENCNLIVIISVGLTSHTWACQKYVQKTHSQYVSNLAYKFICLRKPPSNIYTFLTFAHSFQFIIAALALVAVADRPQPSYRPRPPYVAPTYAAPTYAPAPAYKPIAILEQEEVHPGDGTYSSKFSTENGIYRSVDCRLPCTI